MMLGHAVCPRTTAQMVWHDMGRLQAACTVLQQLPPVSELPDAVHLTCCQSWQISSNSVQAMATLR